MKTILATVDLTIDKHFGNYRITKLTSGTAGVDGSYQVANFNKQELISVIEALLADEAEDGIRSYYAGLKLKGMMK